MVTGLTREPEPTAPLPPVLSTYVGPFTFLCDFEESCYVYILEHLRCRVERHIFFLWLLSCCCMCLPILLSFMLADLQLSPPPPPPHRDHNAFYNLQRFALLCLLISSLSSSIPTPADLSKKQWKGLPLLWSLIWMYIPVSLPWQWRN